MTESFAVVPAAYVLFLRDTPSGAAEVLLQLREGTGYMDGYWAAAAAGHVERGESVFDAAAREVTEELGVTGVHLAPLCAMHRTGATGDPVDERVDYFLRADAWTGEPVIQEPDKCAACSGSRCTTCPTPSYRTSWWCSRRSARAPYRRSSTTGSDPGPRPGGSARQSAQPPVLSGSGAGAPTVGSPSITSGPRSGAKVRRLPGVAGPGAAHRAHRRVRHEVVRRGVGDLDPDHVAGAYVDRPARLVDGREVHQPVVAGAAAEPVGGGVLAPLPSATSSSRVLPTSRLFSSQAMSLTSATSRS